MSEKVKVTREQAEGIESIKNTILKNIAELKHFPARFYEEERPVSELDLKDIESALFDGYEVEEEWKEGDWVVNLVSNEVGKVTEIRNVNGVLGDPTRIIVEGIFCYPQSLRHATEQEIAQEKKQRFWTRIGREVDEYRKGDIIEYDGGVAVVISYKPNDSYLLECSKPYGRSCLNKISFKKVKLVTPVENRLDQ